MCIFLSFHFYRAAYYADAVWQWESCLSIKRVDRDKMEERSVQIFLPYERPFSL